MVAMTAVKDEVADMLSEIRNILKTNKRSKGRERILRSEEIALEVNTKPGNYLETFLLNLNFGQK